jgi:hypothetical protein
MHKAIPTQQTGTAFLRHPLWESWLVHVVGLTTGPSFVFMDFLSTVVAFLQRTYNVLVPSSNHAPYGPNNASKTRTVDTQIYSVCDYVMLIQ